MQANTQSTFKNSNERLNYLRTKAREKRNATKEHVESATLWLEWDKATVTMGKVN